MCGDQKAFKYENNLCIIQRYNYRYIFNYFSISTKVLALGFPEHCVTRNRTEGEDMAARKLANLVPRASEAALHLMVTASQRFHNMDSSDDIANREMVQKLLGPMSPNLHPRLCKGYSTLLFFLREVCVCVFMVRTCQTPSGWFQS